MGRRSHMIGAPLYWLRVCWIHHHNTPKAKVPENGKITLHTTYDLGPLPVNGVYAAPTFEHKRRAGGGKKTKR